MVALPPDRLTGSSGKRQQFRISQQGGCTLNALCKLLLWSCLCCLLAMPVQAQEVRALEDGQDHAMRHHPPQDLPLHEKFYSKWHMPDNPTVSCCNEADCYPTEIKYIDGDIYAKRREDGKYISVPPE